MRTESRWIQSLKPDALLEDVVFAKQWMCDNLCDGLIYFGIANDTVSEAASRKASNKFNVCNNPGLSRAWTLVLDSVIIVKMLVSGEASAYVCQREPIPCV